MPPITRLLFLAAIGVRLLAQTGAPSPLNAAPPPGNAAIVPSAPPVLTLAPQAHCRSAQNAEKNCEVGDTLLVEFLNLREWMAADPAHNKPGDLVLVLNGRLMKGITPRGYDDSFRALPFDLKRVDSEQNDRANRETWNALLGRAKGARTLTVAVASGGNPPYSGTASARFQVFPDYTPLVVAFLAALLILFIILARKSDLLRDPGPDPGPGKRLSYSLARCQMAWWFFLILASYHYIWMVTGDRDSLTPGALILTGISAATGLGAVLVDSSKRTQRQTLESEQNSLQARVAAINAALGTVPPPANAPELQVELHLKQARIAEIVALLGNLPAASRPSQNLLLDILRDENGVSFHRFQMAAWTIVVGFVFIIAVYRDLAMPDFSPTLLGLLGVSAGTYIGFKIPESPKT